MMVGGGIVDVGQFGESQNNICLIVVPNFCWYSGAQYECGLSLSCVFAGAKAMDLCNGGMIWSCCVPRDRITDQVRPISSPVRSFIQVFLSRLTLTPSMP